MSKKEDPNLNETNVSSSASSITPVEEEQIKEALNNKKSKLIWTTQIEELLRRWGDISACYKWLHDESFRMYKQSNYWYSIPIILLSTIAGGLNLSLTGYVPSEYLSISQAGIGALNIFTGVLTTLQNFFKYAQLSESHANASQGWSKLQRNIEVELKLEKEFRTDADRFLRDCRRDYDRLIEQSPPIPKEIINKFKNKFGKEKDLILPDIIDKLTHTDVYREIKQEIVMPPILEKEEIKVINVSDLKDILIDDHHSNHHYQRRYSANHPPRQQLNTNHYEVKKQNHQPNQHITRERPVSVIDDIPENRPKIKDLIKKFTNVEEMLEKKKNILLEGKLEETKVEEIVLEENKVEENKVEENKVEEEKKSELDNMMFNYIPGVLMSTKSVPFSKINSK